MIFLHFDYVRIVVSHVSDIFISVHVQITRELIVSGLQDW